MAKAKTAPAAKAITPAAPAADAQAAPAPAAAPVPAGKGRTYKLRAPQGVAAVGVPLASGDVEQVKVGKDGTVTVGPELAGCLYQQGFIDAD